MLYCKLFKKCFVLLLGLFSISTYASSNAYWHPALIYHINSNGTFSENNSNNTIHYYSNNPATPITTKMQMTTTNNLPSSTLYKGEFQGFQITGMAEQTNIASHSALQIHSLATANPLDIKLK